MAIDKVTLQVLANARAAYREHGLHALSHGAFHLREGSRTSQ